MNCSECGEELESDQYGTFCNNKDCKLKFIEQEEDSDDDQLPLGRFG